jgi:DNA-binding HxlR family transcriptional regulator
MELLDDRWTVLVIRDLLVGRRRFTDLERRLGGITAKTLQQRLVDLEANGLVSVDREPGRRDVWYELTAAGQALSGSLDELLAWGIRFLKRPPQRGELTHYEHMMTALRVMLAKTDPPPKSLTWTFLFDDLHTCGLVYSDDEDTWTFVDGEPAASDLTIECTTDDFAALLSSLPSGRDRAFGQLTLTGTQAHQKLFRRLSDRFPFALD